MLTTITLTPIIAAAAANVVLGYIWYHPRVFGRVWMRSINVTPEMAERGRKRMHLYGSLAFLTSAMLAALMQQLMIAFNIDGLVGAIILSALLWLGLVIPTTIGQIIWEHKPLKLYALNVGFWLVAFVVIGLIVVH